MSRIIVTLSGGLASAWCALWAVKKFGRENVLFYFNDTKWEHPDLYRFIKDISEYAGVSITEDSDGRNPEELFYAKHTLANNRMPFCSRILKAERLQRFYQEGDTLVFGIGDIEKFRAHRIVQRYQVVAARTGKTPKFLFPLLQEKIDLRAWFKTEGITEPVLYTYGFSHNNCAGGCVRAGKNQWVRLYYTFPQIYDDRLRVEAEISRRFNRRMTILKDESLAELRTRIHGGRLDRRYAATLSSLQECIGVCDL